MLRRVTRPQHAAAEGHPLQRALASGNLPKTLYAGYLAQLLHVHSSLEHTLARLAAAGERWAEHAAQLFVHAPHIQQDLALLAPALAGGHAPPTGSTALLVSAIQADTTPAPHVAGMVYVLEGSMNGGRFIAMAVRRAYGLSGASGTRYLDPYADQQQPRWAAFKALLDAAPFDTISQEHAARGADQMFEAIARIGDDLLAGAEAVSGPSR